MAFTVEFGGDAVDVRAHVDAALKLFAPHLAEHAGMIAAAVVTAPQGHRTNWNEAGFSETDAHLLWVITARAGSLAYAEYRRRKMSDPEIAAYRPQGRFKAGPNACARAAVIDGQLFPTNDPLVPPLDDCRTEICTCTFTALNRRQISQGS